MTRPQDTGARQLAAARVFGAAVLADLALLATHAPGGYLGSQEELTRVGALFMGLQLLLTAAAARSASTAAPKTLAAAS